MSPPWYSGEEVFVPHNTVGVDDYSRFRVVKQETCHVEFHPHPFRHPRMALRLAVEVLRWHVDMIRQHGIKLWWADRKL